MKEQIDFIRYLVEKGGPITDGDYRGYGKLVMDLSAGLSSGEITRKEVDGCVNAFGRAMSNHTVQGLALNKPYGYPGDFEIIDRIYNQYVTSEQDLKNWDTYFHKLAASKAVVQRKSYFLNLVSRLEDGAKVLNFASGPARDVYEALNVPQKNSIFFHCIEQDEKAIDYGKSLCSAYTKNVFFEQKNVFRFKPSIRYDLIWAAGLFDYFSDKPFKFLLSKLTAMVKPGGEIVIGNFSPANPTRMHMEVLCRWFLNHRNEEELFRLAKKCGIAPDRIKIEKEESGVILFMHILF